MTTYAIGDVQGCLDPLEELLDKIKFNPKHDQVWFAGDLVNRGHNSLGVLRRVKKLGRSAITVLGNHDLHLLAADIGIKKLSASNEMHSILEAPDRKEIIHWLRQQPLVYRDKKLGFTMVHAGIPPIWTIREALGYAKEVETVLQSKHYQHFLYSMYGNLPDKWDDDLKGNDRLRIITNYFTRMRFCAKNGQLEFKTNAGPQNAPQGFAPWFEHASHKCANKNIIFGHWAALKGETLFENFIGLDTGCVWGEKLTAYRLEDGKRFTIECDC
ncbi:symmetrical bis(5'-nucleosyl)-tetraphosphatase [Teredinibacter purpureus]|jgi:bis(5''-nucleosyl)-tetraphosphatase (symmetrical)|uniref:symmetrical bis(5'-nucleosyl)-tetraphosphatase n=1 Tax=Teredinibacter purpureus TaxID=2731756 RepID=UPI0005F7DBF9|nr:symmetrical bis(5'-nucleosyl)-tetraphosphatase [Teredinibacter purpureus]